MFKQKLTKSVDHLNSGFRPPRIKSRNVDFENILIFNTSFNIRPEKAKNVDTVTSTLTSNVKLNFKNKPKSFVLLIKN